MSKCKISHFSRLNSYPPLNITIGQLMEKAAVKYSSRNMFISVEQQNSKITFQQMLLRADKLAAGLKQLGVEKGDRVGIWSPNCLEWNIPFLAANRAGLITASINPAYQQEEIEYCLNKINARVIFTLNCFKTQNYPEMLQKAKTNCPSLEHVIVMTDDQIKGTMRLKDVEALASEKEIETIAKEQLLISPHDGCNIQFTSGTTGRPKAALLTHFGMINNMNQLEKKLGRNPDEDHHRIVCLNVPFFHGFGLSLGTVSSLLIGSTVVIESTSFNATKSLEALVSSELKCNCIYGTPTMFIAMTLEQRKLNLPLRRCKTALISGANGSSEIYDNMRNILNVETVVTIYGLTENSGAAFIGMRGESCDKADNFVGVVADNQEVKIVDGRGSTVSMGMPGELWVRGNSTMKEYWDDRENTDKTITRDGWLKTGDQFILHEDGCGRVIGRLKDTIIRGGENIFPKEIEDFLQTHPDVAEVHVFGVKDEFYGEVVCASISLRDECLTTGEDIKNYCRGKIAHFKIPRYVELRDNFPKTALGKIQKHVLREEFEKKHNLV